jgi:hypothetical protein
MDMAELRRFEVKYSYALNIGDVPKALLRNHQIYKGLYEMYSNSKDLEEKYEIAYELERLAMQGRILKKQELEGWK